MGEGDPNFSIRIGPKNQLEIGVLLPGMGDLLDLGLDHIHAIQEADTQRPARLPQFAGIKRQAERFGQGGRQYAGRLGKKGLILESFSPSQHPGSLDLVAF